MFFAALFAAGALALPPEPAPPGCAPDKLAVVMAPLNRGPARMTQVSCVHSPNTPYTRSGLRVSPDGRHVFEYQDLQGLRVGDLKWEGKAAFFDLDPMHAYSHWPFAWASDSSFVWSATQDRLAPHGFATGPLEPVRAGRNGHLEKLPPLKGQAARLDSIRWVGGRGLALAELGAHGGQYKPPKNDPDPSLAIIDAARGAVLDVLHFSTLTSLLKPASPIAGVEVLSGIALPGGKVKTLLSTRGQWVVWTQREAPQRLALPYEPMHAAAALTRDGRQLLISLPLQPDGAICEMWNTCRPPKPRTGVIAALHDLDSGRLVWSLTATATDFSSPPQPPEISPDGRYALISMPPTASLPPHVCLVDMKTGAVLQTLAPLSQGAFGFTADGRAWISVANIVALYDLAP